MATRGLAARVGLLSHHRSVDAAHPWPAANDTALAPLARHDRTRSVHFAAVSASLMTQTMRPNRTPRKDGARTGHTKVAKMLPTLCEGGFVERGDNILAFGLPGRGKTHLVCAIGYELIQRGYRVLFTATFAIVQRLLAAKRDLRLERALAALDAYDAVILDDIGYVQQSRDEMEVLFTFLAERYERRSVLITSNVVSSSSASGTGSSRTR